MARVCWGSLGFGGARFAQNGTLNGTWESAARRFVASHATILGWHITGAGVLRVRAPDVCCASRTSTRPSAIVAALAATVVGTSSRWQPTTMATATAQTPRSRRTTEATPSSGSRGCTPGVVKPADARGVSHTERETHRRSPAAI